MAGEHIGVLLVGLGTEDGKTLEVVGDCLTVVNDSGKMVSDGLFWKMLYAGIWKGLSERSIKLGVEKVAAHRTLKQATEEGWKKPWWGSGRVGNLAKLAAAKHLTDSLLIREVVRQRDLAKMLLEHAARVADFSRK